MKLTRPADLGALVRNYRQAHKLRQADLAKRLHVSPKWLSQFENGKATAQVGLIIRVLGEIGFALHAEPIGQLAAAKSDTHKSGSTKTTRPSINEVVDG